MIAQGLDFVFRLKTETRIGTLGMKKNFATVVALALTLLVSADGLYVHAADKTPADKTSSAKATAKNGLTRDLTKVSHDGYGAMRAIHGARIAIFNGETKLVDEMLAKAQKGLDAATKDAQKFAADMKAADHGKKNEKKSASDQMDLIPINSDIMIADTFVPSPEKKTHIEKANTHLKTGHSKEAIEELQLGEIDVIYTVMMLPLESTKKRVADAEGFAKEHKYYEANLALKAAEDGIIVETVDLIETPHSASKEALTVAPQKTDEAVPPAKTAKK
jgi:hypothetical protein